MANALIVHTVADRDYISDRLLPPLILNGFERWLSSERLQSHPATFDAALTWSDIVFLIVSRSASQSEFVQTEVREALASDRPLIPVLTDDTTPDQLVEGLSRLMTVDFRISPERHYLALANALPPIESSDGSVIPPAGRPVAAPRQLPLDLVERIGWNEDEFSNVLARVVRALDLHREHELVRVFEHQVGTWECPYPTGHALGDLKILKSSRRFESMRRIGAVVLAGGVDDSKVRKLYGQALIELGSLDEASSLLQGIVDDANAAPDQVIEARGLIGRAFKQRYVDADDPHTTASEDALRRAIAAYSQVYDEDSSHLWHGINAVSCIQLADRDGVGGADPATATRYAREILANIGVLRQRGRLEVWDRATRVEALVALDDFAQAEDALEDYLIDPALSAFEVSSTYRQFVQVLQLERHARGRQLLEQLWSAVERYRAGSTFQPELRLKPTEEGTTPESSEDEKIHLLVQVTDPSWVPRNVPEFEIMSRMGTVITAVGSVRSIQALLQDPGVVSVEESRPGGTVECANSVPFIGATAAQHTYAEKGDAALLAVIDGGIDVLHEAFRDDQGRSRIIGIWDQTDPTGPPPPNFKLGTYHSEQQIAQYVANNNSPAGLGRDKHGHGTHVASIAAGRGVGSFAGGVAPEAKLLVVISAADGPIGYSRSHVEALAFVDQVATDVGRPVVVNVSQGQNAGAHDGKSALEIAFNSFSGGGRSPGRVIVKSAGNERGKAGHAKITLGADSGEWLGWTRDPGARSRKERIELWWDSADVFSFRLSNPGGEWTPWVGESSPDHGGSFQGGNRFRITHTKRHVDNGHSRLLLEILRGTRTTIETGAWTLELKTGSVSSGGTVDAWIERGAGVATTFTNHQSEEMTLSIPGTAENVIAVGAVEAAMPIRVGPFSSYGPTRDGRNKPDVAAPGVDISAADSGTPSGSRRNSGTSMAAPHVTGAVALLLSLRAKSGKPGLASSQIASALQQKTRNFTGNWDRGQGFGVIDVDALLGAF